MAENRVKIKWIENFNDKLYTTIQFLSNDQKMKSSKFKVYHNFNLSFKNRQQITKNKILTTLLIFLNIPYLSD